MLLGGKCLQRFERIFRVVDAVIGRYDRQDQCQPFRDGDGLAERESCRVARLKHLRKSSIGRQIGKHALAIRGNRGSRFRFCNRGAATVRNSFHDPHHVGGLVVALHSLFLSFGERLARPCEQGLAIPVIQQMMERRWLRQVRISHDQQVRYLIAVLVI
jgi:hypothetical protein